MAFCILHCHFVCIRWVFSNWLVSNGTMTYVTKSIPFFIFRITACMFKTFFVPPAVVLGWLQMDSWKENYTVKSSNFLATIYLLPACFWELLNFPLLLWIIKGKWLFNSPWNMKQIPLPLFSLWQKVCSKQSSSTLQSPSWLGFPLTVAFFGALVVLWCFGAPSTVMENRTSSKKVMMALGCILAGWESFSWDVAGL